MKEISNMPLQKLSMAKKNKQWKQDCVDYIIGHRFYGYSSKDGYKTAANEMQVYEDLYNGIYDEKDLVYVTNPFKQVDGFPAHAQNYNIIKPKIDQLLGEETKKPFNFRVVRTSDIAASEVQDKAKDLIMQYVQAYIQSKESPEAQQQFQDQLDSGEVMNLDQISKYLTQDYKDIAETAAHYSLKYLTQKLNLNHEFYKGYKSGLICGSEAYYVGIKNGQPYAEKVDPRRLTYERTHGLEFIHEAGWCCYDMDLSLTELHDKLYDKLTEKQLNKIIDTLQDGRGTNNSPSLGKNSMDYNHIKTNFLTSTDNPFAEDTIKLYHVCWQSYKKIGFVSFFNPETNQVEEIQVDEQYKETGQEINIEWKWIRENWEGYKIGTEQDDDDSYVGIQPIEYQHVSSDNPNSQKLPYTGIINDKSLVSIMKPLQYMYIILWYRLELALARDKGKILNMDITQIPKSMGIDPQKWMHYLSALGVNFINPYEEGWDIAGREGGKPASFNQITQNDLTVANSINQYIMLMDKVEAMLSEISGITPQRQGAISSSELVGNVERSVLQSSNITEPWVWQHNQAKRQVLIMLLDISKHVWKDNKTNLHYIFDDVTRAFLELSDDFFYSDYDIFVDDSTKNQQQLEMIRNLMQPAMQNGASLLDIAEIITLDNITVIKNKLEEIEQKRMQQQQQMQQQQDAAQQQLVEMQNQAKQEELAIKQQEMELEKYKIDQDNSTKIAVAQMQMYSGVEDLDQDNNGIPDPIEISKQALEQQKAQSEAYRKQKELDIKKNIEREKINLAKEQMNSQKELQKMKDDAAMQREQLKAKTALKNKTTGEK